ncbi:MAG: hypothetical protein K9G27_05835, partial [Sphingomonadaceae bacterium]|nr:hypothetical protein [Sphingomonadaceae bacterium]
MSIFKSGNMDPRSALDPDTLEDANQKILSPVAMPNGLSPGMKLGVLGIGLLAILTFSSLANSRNAANQIAAKPAAAASVQAIPAGGLVPPATLRPGPPELPPPVLVPPPVNNPSGTALGIVGPVAVGPNRLQSPGIVVDATKGGVALVPPTPGLAGVKNEDLSAEDRFSDRVAAGENAPARAVRIANTGYIVPQGAIIAGVLETAINSDLPGYV